MQPGDNPEEDLSEEFRILGQNLVDALHHLWERPERKKLQEEIEAGLNEFAKSLKQEAQEFRRSESVQQIKADFETLQQQVQSGEAEAAMRTELIKALKSINAELSKVVNWLSSSTSREAAEPPPEATLGKPE